MDNPWLVAQQGDSFIKQQKSPPFLWEGLGPHQGTYLGEQGTGWVSAPVCSIGWVLCVVHKLHHRSNGPDHAAIKYDDDDDSGGLYDKMGECLC